MRTVSLPILLIACLLALSACGQKGPLTLPKDEPVGSSIESQVPTENPQAEENDNAPADHGVDDDGDQ